MKDEISIGNPKTLEIGLPKSYSKRKKVCSFKGDPELWSRFKGVCAERGVSICHVLEALEEAWIQGQKAEATLVRPVIINLEMQHIVERPRRIQSFEDAIYHSEHQAWPPNCSNADQFIKSTRDVGCLKLKEWISLKNCWRCFLDANR